MTLDEALAECPAVAIIRGVTPAEAPAIGEALFRAGVRGVEVPLNSPDPLDSIAALVAGFRGRMAIGAGTVLSPEKVEMVCAIGGTLIVSPNSDPAVIRKSVTLGLVPIPGFATASEAFTALQAGARHLKLFPAATYGPGHIKQLKAVLPPTAVVWAVGGVGAQHFDEWWAAGARAFGLGSELYKAGQSAEETYDKAVKVVDAAKRLLR
jgi:2-dehydro-3-deoxyphosphogalactonate aldolase